MIIFLNVMIVLMGLEVIAKTARLMSERAPKVAADLVINVGLLAWACALRW